MEIFYLVTVVSYKCSTQVSSSNIKLLWLLSFNSLPIPRGGVALSVARDVGLEVKSSFDTSGSTSHWISTDVWSLT